MKVIGAPVVCTAWEYVPIAAGASEVCMMVRLMFAFSLMATAGKINDYRDIPQPAHQSGEVRTIFYRNANN